MYKEIIRISFAQQARGIEMSKNSLISRIKNSAAIIMRWYYQV